MRSVDPQELNSLDEELVQLERELDSVELNKVYGPAVRLKVIGCQQKYNGIGGRRSINKGVFWLVASHRKAENLDPLKETVLLIHVVRRGHPPLAIFIEGSVNVAELINAVLEMQKEEENEQMSNQLTLSFADEQLALEKEIGQHNYFRGATFVLSSGKEGSKVENHSGHLLFCLDCKPNKWSKEGGVRRKGRGWSAGWRALKSAHQKMTESEKVWKVIKTFNIFYPELFRKS